MNARELAEAIDKEVQARLGMTPATAVIPAAHALCFYRIGLLIGAALARPGDDEDRDGDGDEDPAEPADDPVWRKILDGLADAPDGLATSQISRRLFSGRLCGKALWAVLAAMQQDGLIESRPAPTKGRTATVWRLR